VCRLSKTKVNEGNILWKYFVCSKEGYRPNKKKVVGEGKSTVKTRRRSSTRVRCNAKVVFKWVDEGKYKLDQFHESHTHSLSSPTKKHFLRSTRIVNPIHK